MWPKEDLLKLMGIELPIIQSPMAGANDSSMAIAVSTAGGLGSLPCAMLSPDQANAEMGVIRQQTEKPYNVNFFCHADTEIDLSEQQTWKEKLRPYFEELEIDPEVPAAGASRAPFSEDMCALVEKHKPNVVSFHFGLPQPDLLDRVKAAGSVVVSSATTVEEAIWLAERGCDAVIAQGYEAGGHRGLFLSDDIATQPGTMALVPQIVDAVNVPVIAAGGIADGRGIAAAFALGAAGVQIGTAYLHTPQAIISELHRNALRSALDNQTALTNLFSGKPARGLMNRLMRELGPMSADAPAFPHAGAGLAPLKARAEASGSADFSSLWSGQSAAIGLTPEGQEMDAGELTQQLAMQAATVFASISSIPKYQG